jgi:hypothetical protein
MESKAHPGSRDRGIGFKIGDVFPADDPIARWATVLGMAANNTVYLNVRMIEGDLPPELNLYYFRLVAAHFFEAVMWLKRTSKTWPEVRELIESLDDQARARYKHLLAFTSPKHPLYPRLRRSRMTTFHYPEMHPEKARAGVEDLANALREAKDLDGWIEGGEEYATFRAPFADEVAAQFLGESEEDTAELMGSLEEPVFELVEFANDVLLAQLTRVSPKKTVMWQKGKARPEIV